MSVSIATLGMFTPATGGYVGGKGGRISTEERIKPSIQILKIQSIENNEQEQRIKIKVKSIKEI